MGEIWKREKQKALRAWENPPRYEVGDATAFYSVTWYASTIAHDATHSELYAQYQAAHPGEPVPEDAYGGVEIERFCIGYQLKISKRIGAPQSETDYLSTLDGTHCDLDNDGDCDWDDYQNRNLVNGEKADTAITTRKSANLRTPKVSAGWY